MMEPKKENIIKALELCANYSPFRCDKCPFEPTPDCYKGSLACNDELMKNALALIKELNEENTRLNKAYSDELKNKYIGNEGESV